MQVLLEDNHLLAVAKPPGLATMGAAPGKPTLLEEAKRYIKQKYGKPGEVYLGVVSRLDAPVSGVVMLARTSKAAARLTAAFRERRVEKLYAAIVEGEASATEGSLVHFLRKDEDRQRMFATADAREGSQRAELDYRVVTPRAECSLLLVRPTTGRKHQIRVQLAKAVGAILGDRKYGAASSFQPGIALHSLRLRLEHPVRREPIEITCPPPPAIVKRFAKAVSELQRAAEVWSVDSQGLS